MFSKLGKHRHIAYENQQKFQNEELIDKFYCTDFHRWTISAFNVIGSFSADEHLLEWNDLFTIGLEQTKLIISTDKTSSLLRPIYSSNKECEDVIWIKWKEKYWPWSNICPYAKIFFEYKAIFKLYNSNVFVIQRLLTI